MRKLRLVAWVVVVVMLGICVYIVRDIQRDKVQLQKALLQQQARRAEVPSDDWGIWVRTPKGGLIRLLYVNEDREYELDMPIKRLHIKELVVDKVVASEDVSEAT